MLSVHELSKRFQVQAGVVAALDNVSFEIPAGELFVLVGDSGSGKTTLLRCVAGLEVPDSGEIRIADELISSHAPPTWVPPQRRRVGMVFQSYAVWPHLTVFENIALPLREGAQRIAPREVTRRVQQALELVELETLATRPATLLSGGQQQRVALARAIAVNSRLLLMDEPLSNLDARLREDVRERIRALAKQLGSTVVYVTHDQVEALAIADRIGLLRAGELVQVGTPQEIYRQPCEPAVADFFGQMNWLDGMSSGACLIETPLGQLRVSQNVEGPVRIGIRPESVVPVQNGVVNVLDARVVSTSFLGEQVVVHLAIGDHRLVSKTRTVPEGCTHVAIDPDDIMVFTA